MASNFAAYSVKSAKFLFVAGDAETARDGAVKSHFLADDGLVNVYAIPAERRAPDSLAEARGIGTEVFRGAKVSDAPGP
jgi:hypothetical protein